MSLFFSFMKNKLSGLGIKIALSIALILGIFWTGFFFLMEKNNEVFIREQLRRQALGIYHYITLTREWISSKEGIYEKGKLGIELITPSTFTNEISEFAKKKLPFSVKVAVLNAINPIHNPDTFEQKAITDFTINSKKEAWETENKDGKKIYRFAAPLIAKDECRVCHLDNDFLDSKGCISVSIPADAIEIEARKNTKYYVIYLVGTLILVLFLLIGMIRQFVLIPLSRLNASYKSVEEGDLTASLDLQESKEWNEVGKSFNNMVSSLHNQHSILQSEVENAVKDLATAYDELKKTEQYKSDFFSNITHDLKTPITALKGAIDLIGKQCQVEENKAYIDIIKRNTEKLASMIKALLDCSRIESGRLELHMETVDMNEVVEDAIMMAMPIALKKGINIQYDVPEKENLVFIDRQRFEQVFLNLLSNAIKFSPEKSNVIVSLNKEDSRIIVTVEDFGPGIKEEDWDLVFEKFFRRSSESAYEGMGLGLAIAKGIVEAHGGNIWISRPAHPGITLNVFIPGADGDG